MCLIELVSKKRTQIKAGSCENASFSLYEDHFQSAKSFSKIIVKCFFIRAFFRIKKELIQGTHPRIFFSMKFLVSPRMDLVQKTLKFFL